MAVDMASGALLREARLRVGLSQVDLAQRAGVTQSVVSAYESGARQPSLPMLSRLIGASGLELAITVRRPSSIFRRLRGPLGVRIRRHHRQVCRIAAGYGLSNVRLFGSVARGEDTEDSDVDLLIDVAQGVGIMGLARCQHDLQALLRAPVDLVPSEDLKAGSAAAIVADALPL